MSKVGSPSGRLRPKIVDSAHAQAPGTILAGRAHTSELSIALPQAPAG